VTERDPARLTRPADVAHAAALFARAREALVAEGFDGTLEEVQAVCDFARGLVLDDAAERREDERQSIVRKIGPEMVDAMRALAKVEGEDWKDHG
jgi:hypothetical protein